MSLPLQGRAIIRGINPSARSLTRLIPLETKHTHLLTYNCQLIRHVTNSINWYCVHLQVDFKSHLLAFYTLYSAGFSMKLSSLARLLSNIYIPCKCWISCPNLLLILHKFFNLFKNIDLKSLSSYYAQNTIHIPFAMHSFVTKQ